MRATVFQLLLTVLCTSSPAATQPQPGPEIGKLVKAFSGTWSIAIKIEPNKGMPKGGVGQGEETWRPGPGGLSLIEEYHSTGDEGELSGLGVAWWDKDAHRYQVTWCDSTAPAGCTVLKYGAEWEGNQVVAMDESENAGKKFVFKEVFSDITENSFTQTLYQGESGSEFKQLLTIVATRKPTPHAEQPDAFMPKSNVSETQSLKLPGPAVQNSMLGTWSLAIKYEPSTELPNGATGLATEVWWAGPGGYSMIEEYYQNDANEHIEEFSPAWWDSQVGGQRFLYCANTAPKGCYISKSVFRWEGNNLVVREERERAGKIITYSLVFTEIGPTSFTQINEEGESGKTPKPTITMRARKVVPATESVGDGHDIDEVKKALTALIDLQLKYDANGVDRLLDGEFLYVSNDGSVMSRADFINLTDRERNPLDLLEVSDVEVHTSGDTAIATGVIHEKGLLYGKPYEFNTPVLITAKTLAAD